MAAFTTRVAAGASLAITAGSTTASFIQAGQARAKQESAERAAARMMQEARSKLDKNVFEDLDINKQVYEIEQERVNQQAQAASLQAGQEGALVKMVRLPLQEEYKWLHKQDKLM